MNDLQKLLDIQRQQKEIADKLKAIHAEREAGIAKINANNETARRAEAADAISQAWGDERVARSTNLTLEEYKESHSYIGGRVVSNDTLDPDAEDGTMGISVKTTGGSNT